MRGVSLNVFAASNGMWKPSSRHATWGRALPRDKSQNMLNNGLLNVFMFTQLKESCFKFLAELSTTRYAGQMSQT